MAVRYENNTAAVNIGSEAGLTAQEGQLTLDARMQMDDTIWWPAAPAIPILRSMAAGL